jgi:hypothetical protein
VDGLGQAVGSGISGLVAGAIGSISAAIGGMADALNDALPPGALPVIGVGLLLLFVWAVIKR